MQTGLVLQICKCELRLWVDRVYLAGADRLDLGVGLRDEAEHDRVQLRLRSVPPAAVPRQGDAGAAVVFRQQERAVTDRRVALLRVADAVVPDGQHVRARQCVPRQDVGEETAP